MNKQRTQRQRDDFAFSLRGFTVISSYAMPFAISDQRFRESEERRVNNHHNAPAQENWVPAEQSAC